MPTRNPNPKQKKESANGRCLQQLAAPERSQSNNTIGLLRALSRLAISIAEACAAVWMVVNLAAAFAILIAIHPMLRASTMSSSVDIYQGTAAAMLATSLKIATVLVILQFLEWTWCMTSNVKSCGGGE
jgi:hypothetical protein